MLKNIIISLIALLLINQANGSEKVIFSEPHCKEYKFASPVTLANGAIRSGTTGGFFCTSQDFPSNYDSLSGDVGKALVEALKNSPQNPIERIQMAEYIFSDVGLASFICSQYQVHPFKISIYTQKTNSEHDTVGLQVKPRDILRNCIGQDLQIMPIGCNEFGSRECPKDRINTMHLKLIEIQRLSGALEHVIGSGNVGRGMYANLEDWLFFSVNSADNPYLCLWSMLDILPDYSPRALKVEYKKCLTENGMIAKNNLLLPFDSMNYYSIFNQQALDSKSIDIVSMDFKDKSLKASILSALENGASVNFIASSDWYYAHITNLKQGTATTDEITTALDLFKLYPKQVNLHFIENNFYRGMTNTLHHKFAVFTTPTGVKVIAGTTNMNRGAITQNFDQAFLLQGELAEQYSDYVNRLKHRSTLIGEMPTTMPVVIVNTTATQ